MSVFNVELVKKVDDSYDIEIGFGLMDKLVADLSAGLAGSVNKFVVVTDSNVEQLYAKPIYNKILDAGYKADIIVFPAGEKSKTRATKEFIEDTMLSKGYRRDCCIIAVGGRILTFHPSSPSFCAWSASGITTQKLRLPALLYLVSSPLKFLNIIRAFSIISSFTFALAMIKFSFIFF